MSNRYLPYGYEIINGETVINLAEAVIVQRMYLQRKRKMSLQSIAEELNSESVLYSANKGWNKNSVARVLQNENYLGNERFPKIIEQDLFSASLEQSAAVTNLYTYKAEIPQDVLWSKLICERCGKPLQRVGSRAASKGILLIKCSDNDCNMRTAASSSQELLESVLRQMMYDNEMTTTPVPEPGIEILKLQNELSRCLDKPDDTQRTKELIFAISAAKYELYERPRIPILKTEESDRPYEIDWKSFARAVSHISINEQNGIHIRYTGGKNNDRNADPSKASDGYTRKSAVDGES